jgi:hypothetical protein
MTPSQAACKPPHPWHWNSCWPAMRCLPNLLMRAVGRSPAGGPRLSLRFCARRRFRQTMGLPGLWASASAQMLLGVLLLVQPTLGQRPAHACGGHHVPQRLAGADVQMNITDCHRLDARRLGRHLRHRSLRVGLRAALGVAVVGAAQRAAPTAAAPSLLVNLSTTAR